MEKCLNFFGVAAGLIGGVFAWIYGDWDALMAALLSLMAIDYITGVVKAAVEKSVSSETGLKGIGKKVLVLGVVGAACIAGRVAGEALPVRETVLSFFAANEAISIMENVAAAGVPLPQKLKDLLLQLRSGGDGES